MAWQTGAINVVDLVLGDQAVERKAGSSFNHDPLGREGSASGGFYLYNDSADYTAIDTALVATQAHGRNLLLSVDGSTWDVLISLSDIPPKSYSPYVRYIVTTTSATPTGSAGLDISINYQMAGGSHSARPPSVITNVTTAAPVPHVWFTTAPKYRSNESITLIGKKIRGVPFKMVIDGKPLTMTQISAQTVAASGGTPQAIVSFSGTNISLQHDVVVLAPPVASNLGGVYPVTSPGDTIFIKVEPNYVGPGTVPPVLSYSSSVARIVPAGVTEAGAILQRRSSFRNNDVRIVDGAPAPAPLYEVKSIATCRVLESSFTVGTDDVLSTDMPTYGLTRWLPISSKIEPATDIGPDATRWRAFNSSRSMVIDDETGPYIDPGTEIEDARAGIYNVPTMVIPAGTSMRSDMTFSNDFLSNGSMTPMMSVFMVVIIGPDPSPTYQEVISGRPQRLTSTPTELIVTTGNEQRGRGRPAVRYQDRTFTAWSTKYRARKTIDFGYLGRRPVIIGLTLGRDRNHDGKRVQVSRMIYVGSRMHRVSLGIASGEVAQDISFQIGRYGRGESFRVLELLAGPALDRSDETRLVNRLDSTYKVMAP